MADIGRRQEVTDPLAMNPLRRDTERSLPTYGVRNPGQTGGDAATRHGLSGLNVIDGLQAVAGRVFQQAAETSITEGKLAWMQGTTEAEMTARGDKYQSRGWQAMQSANQANDWFIQEAEFIQNDGMQLDPTAYRARLMDSRKAALDNLPEDPQSRAMWAAAFDDFGPRLVQMQTEQHNKYNEQRSEAELANLISGTAATSTDASVPVGGFRVSQEQVRTPLLNQTEADRDFGIRTLLGEAAGEGQQGMAAVAHVIMNRMGSTRFNYKTVKDAVLADKQFSTWNTGEGGNDPSKWNPDSAQYKRAAQVWDAVTAGNHVDPTGGSTHYYSPRGMKNGQAPDWWNSEAKNGQVRIGNHIFAVAGRPGNGPKGELQFQDAENPLGKLAFKNKGQGGLEPNFKSVLEEVAGEFGGTLKITSGLRNAEYNAKVGGAKNSRHVRGDAADIDMTGMSDADRAKMVDSLRAKGAKGFITYSGSPNMLHVDMHDRRGDGKGHYMFDRSSDNLNKAPAWFRQMAATDEGGTNVQRRGTQLQAIIDSSTVKPAGKARVVADVLRRSLDAGSDAEFNDLGGISYLYGLGATAADIDSVLKAKERFDNEQDKKFDMQRERKRSDLLARVQSGEFGTMDDVDAAVNELLNEEKFSDGEARALYRQVAADMQKAGDTIIPIEMRSLLTQKFDEVDGGYKTPEEASKDIEEYAKANGIKASVANNMMQSIFSRAQANKDKLRTEARNEQKRVTDEKKVREQAEAALTTGYGLKGLGGKHRIPDDNGGVKEVTGEQYGIWALKQSATKDAQAYVEQNMRPGMTAGQIEQLQSEAEVQYNKTVYENLRKQGVYDKEFGEYIRAAVTGGILGEDGKITEAAQRGFDTYMQLINNPKVGEEYVSGMIQDPEARSFLETARHYYDGRNDIGQALMKASTDLSRELKPEQRIKRTTDFEIKAGTAIRDTLNGMMRSESWLRTSAWSEDQRAAVRRESPMLQSYVYRQAQFYNQQNPNEPTEVSIKKAAQDLQRNAIIVGSDVILGNESNGTRLDQVMGLERLGRQAPHRAVSEYVQDVLSNDPKWKNLWDQQERTSVQGVGGLGDLGGGGKFSSEQAQFSTWFNPMDGTLQLTLYKDQSRTEQLGESIFVPASAVGDWYKQRVSAGQPNFLERMWRRGIDNLADQNQARNVREAGAAIGAMVGN